MTAVKNTLNLTVPAHNVFEFSPLANVKELLFVSIANFATTFFISPLSPIKLNSTSYSNFDCNSYTCYSVLMQYKIIVIYTTAIVIECNLSLRQCMCIIISQCYTHCNSRKLDILHASTKDTSHQFVTIVKLL